MKDSDSTCRSSKKANGNTGAKISSSSAPNKNNGFVGSTKRSKTTKTTKSTKSKMGATSSRSTKPTNSPKAITKTNKSPRKSNKQSPELRPRRRASQTYFFKYQLARNPLKAEEEDLKLALLASLQQCNNNDLTSVQNKIKKAKKVLQNKQANKSKSNALIGKYSALRKFPSNSNLTLSPPAKRQSGSLLLSPTKNANNSKSRSKLNNCYDNNVSTTGITNTTSSGHYFTPYSPYTPLQKKEPPDEDYLRKYKPETEDFLSFICFRTTAPNYQNKTIADIETNGLDDSNNNCTTQTINYNTNPGIGRITDKQVPDPQNLKQCTSTLYRLSNINGSPTNNDHQSPNNQRRPTRQSPRLASSNRKISENDSSNYTIGTSATAYDNSITYEEDMKRASIALEDMAQEINSSDDIHNEVAQNTPDCISKSSSPYRHNKHLVKGLMTREFAGAFADEETIFESISNHKL